MHSKTKFFGLICFLSALCACSSHKEVLKGERISVLDDQAHFAVQSEKSEASFNISSPLENETWTQTGSNASHKMQNFLAGKDMTEIWSSSFGEGSSKRNLLLSRPVVSKDKIYAQDVNATVYAFDLKTGKQLFKQKLKTINKNDSASGLNGVGLALENDRLYALAGFGSVFALDADSGKILWRKDLKVPLRTAPTIASGKLFIQFIGNSRYRYSIISHININLLLLILTQTAHSKSPQVLQSHIHNHIIMNNEPETIKIPGSYFHYSLDKLL